MGQNRACFLLMWYDTVGFAMKMPPHTKCPRNRMCKYNLERLIFFMLLIILKNNYSRKKNHLCFFYILQLTKIKINRQRSVRRKYLGVRYSLVYT